MKEIILKLNSKDIKIQEKDSKVELYNLKNKLLSNLISQLDQRFPDKPLVTAMKIFSTNAYSRLSHEINSKYKDEMHNSTFNIYITDEFKNFGEQEFLLLSNFYAKPKKNINGINFIPLISGQGLNEEWKNAKKMLFKYKDLDSNLGWSLFSKEYQNIFPNFIKLGNLLYTLPVSTSICERGFSVQNLIKNKLRNRFTVENLECAMRIMISGKKFENFNFDASLENWKRRKSREIFNP